MKRTAARVQSYKKGYGNCYPDQIVLQVKHYANHINTVYDTEEPKQVQN